MSLVGRVLVIALALLLASMAAAFIIAFGILMEWHELFAGTGEAGWLTFGVFGLISSMKGLLPALLVIVIAEALSIRASLFYAAVGGLGLVGLYYGLGLAEREPDLLIRRDLEIMAGAGIAAGFVYWIIAGRKAGAWREPKAASIERR
jgi:hypothetical protein